MAAVALRVIESGTADMPLALDLSPDTDFEEWVAIGRRLCIGSQAVNWHIGDWWRHGVTHYGEDQTREAAKEIWGIESETARNYGWVASKFDPVRRLTEVSFSHYQVAASLPATDAMQLVSRAAEQHLSVRDLRREVQAIKASNDPAVGEVQRATPAAVPKPNRTELEEAYARYIEAMEALEAFRPLTTREQDFLGLAQDHLDEAHADRRQVPDDFRIIFVEQGRLACETHYRASRITVNRWLVQSGKKALIDERADFVKHQRSMAHAPARQAEQAVAEIDTYLPVAKMAADFLRIRRNGGWMISACETGGWRVGTVHRTSEALIEMAERQGFDRAAAVAEATAEGY